MAALLRECKFTPTLPCLLHIQMPSHLTLNITVLSC
ncbi:hypothetical protein T4C_6765, partial [Trichinella pseudospiralis]